MTVKYRSFFFIWDFEQFKFGRTNNTIDRWSWSSSSIVRLLGCSVCTKSNRCVWSPNLYTLWMDTLNMYSYQTNKKNNRKRERSRRRQRQINDKNWIFSLFNFATREKLAATSAVLKLFKLIRFAVTKIIYRTKEYFGVILGNVRVYQNLWADKVNFQWMVQF